MIDKSINGINCGYLNVTIEHLNITDANDFEDAISNFYNVTSNGTHSHRSLEQEVCRAEIESQKLISFISGYMAPLESIIGVAVILIGGYLSDITGLRKPLILYPIVGDFLAQLVSLIGAMYMTVLPVEFVAILASLVRALSGGLNLLWMGVFCYVIEITAEKDRLFRFGLIYQLFPLMAICTLPFSGILYQQLGYIKLILIALIFEACGILYLVVMLKEAAVKIEENLSLDKKPTTDQTELNNQTTLEEANKSEQKLSNDKLDTSKIDLIRNEMVDAVRKVLLVLMRRRSGKGRLIVWLLLFCNFLLVGCEYEIVNQYFFVRTKLNWEALEESPFAAYGSGISLFGNILMTTVFSKYFQIPHKIIGLISSTFATVAKLTYITVSTTFMLYVARSFDMFTEASSVASRCILSTVVDKSEIGRIFSLMGVLDNLSKLIFVPIYTNVYKLTVDTFPNAYFIVSFGAMALVAAIFGLLCSYMNSPSTDVSNATDDSLTATRRTAINPSGDEIELN